MPAPQSEYEKAQAKYRAIAMQAAQAPPDSPIRQDKVKAHQEVIAIEREAARAGTVLSAEYRGDRVVTKQVATDSKRSLQEEYVRKFDDEVVVELPDRPDEPAKKTTLRDWHKRRLFGGK